MGGLRCHVFLCRGPRCCSAERGEAVWKYLKDRLKALGLSGRGGRVYRTKVDCLRICLDGPVALVYPEGTWYHQVDEARMERIIQSHILRGKPLEKEAFAVNPLTSEKRPGDESS
ncbi:MAG: (2Fe-2S) ferredoxin domain-containing protein [Verrucomicrobia bacterium]|nr:(2Fe-2S) ferredoxin domain-containing protein [Verrucomicrobiota bacterium]